MRSNLLFDPVANLKRTPFGLRVIRGDAAVGQACCDPATFADVTTLVDGHASGAPPVDERARALLRMVWPSTVAQARLQWGRRVAGPRRVDELVAGVVGVPAAMLRAVVEQSRDVQRGCADDVARAAAPLALLREAVAGVVRRRAGSAGEPGRTDTVLDELLFWRGLGRERVSLDEVAGLVAALIAAAWDAAHVPPGRTVGWLRVTTQAVLLDGETIPAGERCLLLVDAVEPGDRPARAALRTLRWLAPGAPDGAGATFARLVVDAIAGEASGTAAA
ncbi:hypothetical protein [Dactylosporangium darangshiense]|uniref:Cytochrome P450 n=1 Tax=Dactylosporangium darangshiense TaxID=579108 RepID=A0ABP8DLQ0_9ACTN